MAAIAKVMKATLVLPSFDHTSYRADDSDFMDLLDWQHFIKARKDDVHIVGTLPSHMISAPMKGLTRLAYEFSDLVSTAYNVLPSTFLLLERKNREIAKANSGLLKVLVAKSQTEGLQMQLRSMVEFWVVFSTQMPHI